MKTLSALLLLLMVSSCHLKDLPSRRHEPEEPAKAVVGAHEPGEKSPATMRMDPLIGQKQTPARIPDYPPEKGRDEPLEPRPERNTTLLGDSRQDRNSLRWTFNFFYGVSLPRSVSTLRLEPVIGSGNFWQVQLPRSLHERANEFAWEIVIAIGKTNIYVNNYEAARIQCTTDDGKPCPAEAYGEEGTRNVKVLASLKGATAPEEDPYLLASLRMHVRDYQMARRLLLSTINDRAASWLLECDAYTLAVDRNTPYGVITQVIHTLAKEDLTKARLALLGQDDAVVYIPLYSPRLDRFQQGAAHIVGGKWWKKECAERSGELGVAYLGFSGSAFPDDFRGFEDPSLPSCLPLGVSWDRVLSDPEYARSVAGLLNDHIAAISRSHGDVLGLVKMGENQARGVVYVPSGLLASGDIEPGEATLRREWIAGFSGPKTIPGNLPENRLVPDGEDRTLLSQVRHEPGILSETNKPDVDAWFFVTLDAFIIALKVREQEKLEIHRLSLDDKEKLYDLLSLVPGHLAHVGAASNVPAHHLVSALDLIRQRCVVRTMSGRCKKWEPLLPTIYLFAAPGDVFIRDELGPSNTTSAAPAGKEESSTTNAPLASDKRPFVPKAPVQNAR